MRRDQFYDGHVKQERVAVVARLSPSFIRFGSFEIFYYRHEYDNIRTLADFTIAHHFPHILKDEPEECHVVGCKKDAERYKRWFEEIVNRTASLIAIWQSIGFGK